MQIWDGCLWIVGIVIWSFTDIGRILSLFYLVIFCETEYIKEKLYANNNFNFCNYKAYIHGSL